MLEAFYWQNRFSSKLIDLLLVIIGFTTSYKHKTKYWVVVRENSSHATKCEVGLLFIQNKLPQKNLDFQNIKKAILGHSGRNFFVIKTLKGIFYNNSLISFCKNFFFFRLGLQEFFFQAFWLARIFFLYFPHPPPHHFSNGPSLTPWRKPDFCSKYKYSFKRLKSN